MAATVSVESPDREDTPVGLLAAITGTQATAIRAEIEKFRQAAVWADLHPVESVTDAASLPGTEGEVLIAGPGAPLVAEWCILELAAAFGLSTDAGRQLLGDAVETRHRLPRIWAGVLAGRVPVWKARRVAQQTISLSKAAAAFVDAHLAPALKSSSPTPSACSRTATAPPPAATSTTSSPTPGAARRARATSPRSADATIA